MTDFQIKDNLRDRIPLCRAGSLHKAISFLDEIGTPSQTLLEKSGLPVELTENPEAILPARNVHSFLRIASKAVGMDDFGLQLGSNISVLKDLGKYSDAMGSSNTIDDFLREGIQRLGYMTNVLKIWLTDSGENVRVNFEVPTLDKVGTSQVILFNLFLNINTIVVASAGLWRPDKIYLNAKFEIPDLNRDILNGVRIIPVPTVSGFYLPKSVLFLSINKNSREPSSDGTAGLELPSDFLGTVRQTIQFMLPSGYPDIHTAAEMAGMGMRTFQRRLTASGNIYTNVVNDVRMKVATDMLANGDRPITDIANALGYSDPANFTRSFRKKYQTSPTQYRYFTQNSSS